MKNQNSFAQRALRFFKERWSESDYPGGDPRFQATSFAKDIGLFVFLPAFPVFIYCVFWGSRPVTKRSQAQTAIRDFALTEGNKSQIIEFKGAGTSSNIGGLPKRTPGALVRLRLLNVVETYSTAPVHAQIVDAGLGSTLVGGTLIGDATPDENFQRIAITFHHFKDPNREGMGGTISARALSLDGTLGLVAAKKEGIATRSALGSGNSVSQDAQGRLPGSSDLNQILIKALSAGLLQEFGSATQVEKNRANVLTLSPSTEFFAELIDFFPGTKK